MFRTALQHLKLTGLGSGRKSPARMRGSMYRILRCGSAASSPAVRNGKPPAANSRRAHQLLKACGQRWVGSRICMPIVGRTSCSLKGKHQPAGHTARRRRPTRRSSCRRTPDTTAPAETSALQQSSRLRRHTPQQRDHIGTGGLMSTWCNGAFVMRQ